MLLLLLRWLLLLPLEHRGQGHRQWSRRLLLLLQRCLLSLLLWGLLRRLKLLGLLLDLLGLLSLLLQLLMLLLLNLQLQLLLLQRLLLLPLQLPHGVAQLAH